MTDCQICKRHYSQSGKCNENKSNCLFFEEEPRGKKMRTSFTFQMNSRAETPVIKYNSKIIFSDKNKDIEMTVIKINWINLENMTCNIEAEYHENEMPNFERKKMFKVIRFR